MPRAGNMDIYIDADEFKDKVDRLRHGLNESAADRVMFWVCDKTGRKVRKIVKKDVPLEYQAKESWVGAAVGNRKMESGENGGVQCVIPLKGKRGLIGGEEKEKGKRRGGLHFAVMSGGARGWNSLRGKYRISTAIVNGESSILPERMVHQGGFPPFRNLSAPKLNGLTFTRLSKEQKPIQKVAGIAVPQMVMNRSEERIREDILKALSEQLDYYMERMLP